MANFWVNSSSTIALRLSSIEKVYISSSDGSFKVNVRNIHSDEDTVESASSLEDAQALALPLLTALEA